jgi:acetyltransferase-like isoleucine patch superfamily enzyme
MRYLLFKLMSIVRPMFQPNFMRRKIKLHRSARIFHGENLVAGEYIYIGPGVMINAQGGVEIGTGSIIAPEVTIFSSSHDYRSGDLLPYDVFDNNRPVRIGQGVWIGYRALICPGVTIGDGAIIAMGAVVSRDVGRGEVVGGNPAKVISMRDQSRIDQMIEDKAFFHRRYWGGSRPRQIVDRM